MSETDNPTEGFTPDVDLFDPTQAVVSSPLSGRKGVIQPGASFVKHNYGGKIAEMANALRITVVSPDLDKPRVNLIGTGALEPAEKVGERPDGRPILRKSGKEGNFPIGTQLEKRSNYYDFLVALAASGFPMEKFKAEGAAGLEYAAFIWRAVEKKLGRESKVYDVPAEFLGFEEPGETSGAAADPTITANRTEATGGTSSATADEVKAKMNEAVIAALKKMPGQTLPKSQLSIKVSAELQGYARKGDVLAALLKDSNIAAIPGVTYDNKLVKLTGSAAQAEAAPEVATETVAVDAASEEVKA